MQVDLRVEPTADESDGEHEAWSALLHRELDEFDDAQVTAARQAGPTGAKGLGLGALAAKVPKDAVRKLLEVVRAFAVRTGRTVEASIDGDTIKITGADREQQDRVIEAWLARHPAGS